MPSLIGQSRGNLGQSRVISGGLSPQARVLNLVEVSYSLDPRVHAMQLREKEARANAKA